MCLTGKAKTAGPEVKRGRSDLAEVLWQSSNPYKDGRSLGDQWLDAKGKQRVEGPEMRRGRRVCFLCVCTHTCTGSIAWGVLSLQLAVPDLQAWGCV